MHAGCRLPAAVVAAGCGGRCPWPAAVAGAGAGCRLPVLADGCRCWLTVSVPAAVAGVGTGVAVGTGASPKCQIPRARVRDVLMVALERHPGARQQ